MSAAPSPPPPRTQHGHVLRLLRRRSLGVDGPSSYKLKCWLEDRFLSHNSTGQLAFPTGRSTIALAFSHDGRRIASTHGDHTVKVFSFPQCAMLSELHGLPRTPWSVKFHPTNSDLLASGCLSSSMVPSEVRVWNVVTGQCLAMIHIKYHALSLCFHPFGDLIAIACGQELRVWRHEVHGAKSNMMLQDCRRYLRCVAFHPSGEYMFIGCDARLDTAAPRRFLIELQMWRFDHAQCLMMFRDHHIQPHPLSDLHVISNQAIAFNDAGLDVSPCGRYLLTCLASASAMQSSRPQSAASTDLDGDVDMSTGRAAGADGGAPAPAPAPADASMDGPPVLRRRVQPWTDRASPLSSVALSSSPVEALAAGTPPAVIRTDLPAAGAAEPPAHTARPRIRELSTSSDTEMGSGVPSPGLSPVPAPAPAAARPFGSINGSNAEPATASSSPSEPPVAMWVNGARRTPPPPAPASAPKSPSATPVGTSGPSDTSSKEPPPIPRFPVRAGRPAGRMANLPALAIAQGGSRTIAPPAAIPSAVVRPRAAVTPDAGPSPCYIGLLSVTAPTIGREVALTQLDGIGNCDPTSIKFSPTMRYVVVALQTRDAVEPDSDRPRPVTTVRSIFQANPRWTFSSAMDEVNTAAFHPLPGHGIVYGTRDARLRVILPESR